MRQFLFAASLIVGALCQSIVTGQTAIDLDSKVEIQFDGKSEAEITIEALLIDGFAYRFPVVLTVGEGVKLDDLIGKTICQCASLQFSKMSYSICH